MNPLAVKERLSRALQLVVIQDRFLLEGNLHERCLAARLAIYLQRCFRRYSVDVEYNRHGCDPKRLNLPAHCTKSVDDSGNTLVVPDLIIHKRGEMGSNLLVVEIKKSSNPVSAECDGLRVRAFREQLGYRFGALVLCETRTGYEPKALISEWLE